jgi:hypothetical protein
MLFLLSYFPSSFPFVLFSVFAIPLLSFYFLILIPLLLLPFLTPYFSSIPSPSFLSLLYSPLLSHAFSPITLLFSPLGTNAFPSAAESYYYNKKDYLNKYLDYSQLSEKDKNSMHSLVDHHKSHGMF